MLKVKMKRKIKNNPIPYIDDLKNIFRRSIIVLTDYENIHPKPNKYEKGFIYPCEMFPYYGIIIIIKNNIDNLDDLCLTLLHELIHLWLYEKGIHEHNEDYIEYHAKRIYEIDKRNVLRFVNKHFSYIFNKYD